MNNYSAEKVKKFAGIYDTSTLPIFQLFLESQWKQWVQKEMRMKFLRSTQVTVKIRSVDIWNTWDTDLK